MWYTDSTVITYFLLCSSRTKKLEKTFKSPPTELSFFWHLYIFFSSPAVIFRLYLSMISTPALSHNSVWISAHILIKRFFQRRRIDTCDDVTRPIKDADSIGNAVLEAVSLLVFHGKVSALEIGRDKRRRKIQRHSLNWRKGSYNTNKLLMVLRSTLGCSKQVYPQINSHLASILSYSHILV